MLAETAQEEGLQDFVADLSKISIAGHQLLSTLNSRFDIASEMRSGGAPPLTTAVNANVYAHRSPTPSGTLAGAVSPASAQTGTLLVVDDNELNRDVLSKRLNRLGHIVIAVASGLEALGELQSRAFDVILLDVMMPDMDGIEVLKRIKADFNLSHIPVVMISAVTDLESITHCIELGADDYLPKPFDPHLLKARVGSCLSKKLAHDREALLFGQIRDNYHRLQILEKQRDDLMNMIVHDLRTPLTSVIGGLQTLELIGPMNAPQLEMVEISISGTDTLLGLINDLLDVEKLESGVMQLDYAPMMLADVTQKAVRQVVNLAHNKQIAIECHVADDLPCIEGDASKLCRAIVNLLGNALKFTPSLGTVVLSVISDVPRHSVTVSVADSGEGIPAEAFATIFEKFGQVASRKGGRLMSTGLGLTFCKLVVEAHGGQITVRSEMGKGSTFSFEIPACREVGQ
jgi:signal transduction histidine kinase